MEENRDNPSEIIFHLSIAAAISSQSFQDNVAVRDVLASLSDCCVGNKSAIGDLYVVENDLAVKLPNDSLLSAQDCREIRYSVEGKVLASTLVNIDPAPATGTAPAPLPSLTNGYGAMMSSIVRLMFFVLVSDVPKPETSVSDQIRAVESEIQFLRQQLLSPGIDENTKKQLMQLLLLARQERISLKSQADASCKKFLCVTEAF